MDQPRPFLLEVDFDSGAAKFEPGDGHERFGESLASYEDGGVRWSLGGLALEVVGGEADGPAAVAHAATRDLPALLRRLRGTFYGAHLDRERGEWRVFVDQIGSKGLFYYADARRAIVSSSIATVAHRMRARGLAAPVDRHGAYALLTYGWCVDDLTLIEGIRPLRAGRLLAIAPARRRVRERVYYRLPAVGTFPGTFREATDELEVRFARAIRRAFTRDRVAGLTPVVTLSGGLDSRMTAFAALGAGFGDQLNLTFAGAGSPDERTARRIAADYGLEWLYKSLDGGGYLRALERLTPMLEGRVAIHGAAHLHALLRRLAWGGLGMLHTGQNGDVVVGWRVTRRSAPGFAGVGAADATLLHRLADHRPDVTYASAQEHLFANRFFRGNGSSMAAAQRLTETYAPFTDVDVLDHCLSLPRGFRVRHRLYRAWIARHHPAADAYPWAETGARPSAWGLRWGEHRYPPTQLGGRLADALPVVGPWRASRRKMVALDRYYATNEGLRGYLDGYLARHLDLLADPTLRADAAALYRGGSTANRLQVVSLLAAVKYLGGS